jgi:hypothetical protein
MSEPRVRPVPIQINQVEVSVRTENDQFPTLPMSRSCSYISTDPQERYKAHEVTQVSLNVDAESGLEEK